MGRSPYSTADYNETVAAYKASGALSGLGKPTQDLFIAATTSDVDGIKDAVARGANVKAVDTSGFNAAHHAAGTILEFKDPSLYGELLGALKDGGVDMNHKPGGYGTPLQEFIKGYKEEADIGEIPIDKLKEIHAGAIQAFKAAGVDVSTYQQGSSVRGK